MADNYILTPEGKQQLEEELHYLETEKRAEVGAVSYTHLDVYKRQAYVNAVDISELAVAQARKNAQLNGLDERMGFTATNVFDLLPALEAAHDRTYDFIVLDPPAFTKSRKTIQSASRGYKEINYRAMKLLPRGGYLATCSCSHFMDTERFKHVVASAAHDAGVQLRQIEERQQAPDHPIVWGVPETDYLKFFIFQVV